MNSHRVRTWGGRAIRGSALLLTAAVAIGGPISMSIPATAQEDTPGKDLASPPEVDRSALPTDTRKPDKDYRHEIDCVERDLDNDIVLQRAPWGQQYLRLDDVHSLMQNTVGSVGEHTDGKPVRVAVIDTGVTGSHDFLEGRVKPGGEYVKDDSDEPGMKDCDGHGTEVAGIIGADTPGNIKFTGVAPDVEILSIRQSSQNYVPDEDDAAEGDDSDDTDDSAARANPPAPPDAAATDSAQGGRNQEEEGTAGTLDTLAQAVRGAAEKDSDVINISINNCRMSSQGMSDGERKLQAAVHYATAEKDAVVVSAAGNVTKNCEQNDQEDPDAPGTIVTPPWFAEDVLSVAAVDQTGSVADFSIYGPWVSVAAPGTEIISLDPAGSDSLANLTVEGEGEAQPIQGTSFAAPYVAGLASLVRAKYPDLDAYEVMERIEFTAHQPAAEGGRDNFVGHGVIDPMAALTATVPEEEGLDPAQNENVPSDMVPAQESDRTPMIVALVGSGAALAALVITIFVVHTIRRNRT